MKTYPPVAADIPIREVMAAWRSREAVESSLQRVGDLLQVGHLFPVNSGRTALYIILKAWFSPGAKIILPGYTCYTVPAAVVKAGMTPVISDSDPQDLGYNLDSLKKTIEKHPDAGAVVVCHLFGIGLDIDAIRAVVGPNMMIIDDAAQAFGIEIGGRYLGTRGDVGFYSFGRGKNLSLVGGGLIGTNDDMIAGKIERIMGEHIAGDSVSGSDLIKLLAYNTVTRPSVYNLLSRFPGMKLGRSEYRPDFDVAGMAVGRIRLLGRICGKIENLNLHRDKIADRYLDLLGAVSGITIPRSRLNDRPGSLRFPVLVHDASRRKAILEKSRNRGWGISAMYPTALRAVPALTGYAAGDQSGSERIAATILTLPTHRHLKTADNRHEVIEKIAGLLR